MNGRSFTFAIFVLLSDWQYSALFHLLLQIHGCIKKYRVHVTCCWYLLLAIQDVYKFQWFCKFTKLI